jgi:UDP-glucuronate 4-epimerase
VLEACRNYQVKHLIYASSSSVYGANTKIPFATKDSVDHPVSLYAATKKANELMAHSYSHLFVIPTTGLRFFTVYGPWGRPDMAYYTFTKNMIEGKTVKLF